VEPKPKPKPKATVLTFDEGEGEEVTGYRAPRTEAAPTDWKQNRVERAVKDALLLP
jgi:hypothetical protein